MIDEIPCPKCGTSTVKLSVFRNKVEVYRHCLKCKWYEKSGEDPAINPLFGAAPLSRAQRRAQRARSSTKIDGGTVDTSDTRK